MRYALLLAVIFATGLSALGCKKSGGTVKGPVQTNMEYNYTYDKREVFIDDASADLMELDQRINELSEKAATAGAGVQAAAQPRIEEIRKQRVALDKKLNTLRTASESNWNELKADYQKADSQMKTCLRESWQWVKDNTRS